MVRGFLTLEDGETCQSIRSLRLFNPEGCIKVSIWIPIFCEEPTIVDCLLIFRLWHRMSGLVGYSLIGPLQYHGDFF